MHPKCVLLLGAGKCRFLAGHTLRSSYRPCEICASTFIFFLGSFFFFFCTLVLCVICMFVWQRVLGCGSRCSPRARAGRSGRGQFCLGMSEPVGACWQGWETRPPSLLSMAKNIWVLAACGLGDSSLWTREEPKPCPGLIPCWAASLCGLSKNKFIKWSWGERNKISWRNGLQV